MSREETGTLGPNGRRSSDSVNPITKIKSPGRRVTDHEMMKAMINIKLVAITLLTVNSILIAGDTFISYILDECI